MVSYLARSLIVILGLSPNQKTGALEVQLNLFIWYVVPKLSRLSGLQLFDVVSVQTTQSFGVYETSDALSDLL